MREFWLTSIPSPKSIQTAIHQDEGVILDTEEGLRFSFVPLLLEPSERNRLTIGGEYFQIIDDQFTGLQGAGRLVLCDLNSSEPSAQLQLLHIDKEI